MTKLASENATNKANAQGFSLKEGRAAVDGQGAVDAAAKAAVAAPVKAALNGKPGAGVAAPAPAKANAHVDAVKKEERDEDGKLINKASEETEGKGEHLAMVDASASAAVGTLSPEAGQDAGGASSSGSSDDDGGDSTPLIIGGVVLLGGGAALAAGGGGGKKNTAPTVNATQAVTTNEDTKATITVAGTDADGDTLTYTASAPTKGAVTVAGNVLTYTPNANANGTDTFTVTVSDGKGGTATQTVTVTITPVNDAPVGVAATGAATEDGAVVTGKLAATDVDGDTLTYTLNAPVTGLTLNADGSYSFDPASYDSLAAGATQAVVANYTVSDGKGGTATSTLTITVTGINDAPVATAATNTATEDGAVVTGQLVATDADTGATLTYAISGTAPAGLTINANGSYSFDPGSYDSIPAGVVQDVVATYTVTDDKGASSNSTLTIKVTGVNDAPTVAATQTVTGTEDQPVTVTVAGADVDGDTLTYTAGAATKGVVTAGSTAGSFIYTPNANANGTDTFTVTVSDGKGGTATQTVTVNIAAVNDAPVAVDDAFTVAEDTALSGSVALNDTDVDGDALTYALNGTAPAGLAFNPDGTFSFNADDPAYDSIAAGATRVVTFSYTVSDGKGGSTVGAANITVTGANDSPTVAATQTVAGIEDQPSTIAIAATDIDGDTLTYTAGAATKGVVTAGSTAGTFIYTPNANANGSDTFTVTVSDGKGGTAVQTVTVNIAPVNDAPVAVDDTFTVAEDTALSGSVALNDTDIDGDTLTYALAAGTVPAGLVFNPDGTFGFDADDPSYDSIAAGATRVVTFNYTVSDGHGGTDTGAASITITGANDAPVLTSATTGNFNENIAAGSTVYTATATDVDAGSVLSYSITGADAGLLAINASTGAVTILGSPNYEAKQSYSFTVTVSDGIASASQAVTLGVNNLVDVFNADIGDPVTPVTIDASGNDAADILDVNYQFNESANLPSDVVIQNFGSNDYILFSTNIANYNFNNDNGDLVITQNNGGVVSTIRIDNILNPGLQLANNEAAVETALNNALGTTGIDYLRGSSVPSVTRSADIDNDNNANTPASASGPSPLPPLAALDAAGAAVTYTENGNTANTVIISNFTSDDHIIATAPVDSYSFGTDNNQDLTITWNNNGVVNQITLEGFFAAPPPLDAFLGGLQSLEAYVGFDFFSYA